MSSSRPFKMGCRRCKDGKDVDYEHDLDVDWELLWDVKKLAEVLRLEGFA